jgi:hypothetical protein
MRFSRMMVSATRQFRVFARDLPDHRARLIAEPSFEAAAIAYVEDWPHTIDDDTAVRVVVRDCETGHERCFAIDLDTGAAAPCA